MREPLDFGGWITAHGPEYMRMVEYMYEYRVTCEDVIEWIKKARTCINCEEVSDDWREYGDSVMCMKCTRARDEEEVSE